MRCTVAVWSLGVIAVMSSGCDHRTQGGMDAGSGSDVPVVPCVSNDGGRAIAEAPCFGVLPPYTGECATACGIAPRSPAEGSIVPAQRTVNFVMDSIRIDDANGPDLPNTYFGFDLDGLASSDYESSGCYHQDLFPTLDRDQMAPACCVPGDTGCNGGVDNQSPDLATTLQTATGSDVRQEIYDDIQNGRLLGVLQLTDVDSWTDDPDVGLTMLLAFDSDSDCTNNLGGAGSLLIDAQSYDDSVPPQPRWHTSGRIVAGTFYSNSPFAGLGLWLIPVHSKLAPIHDTQIRFGVVSGGAEIRDGNLGGWIAANDFLVALAPAFPPGWATVVEGAIGGLVDLRVNPDTGNLDVTCGVCNDPPLTDGGPRRFGGIAEGFGFTAVRVTLAGTAAAAPDGACGHP